MKEEFKSIFTQDCKNVMFFLLGMAFMATSSTIIMSLGEKYNLVEHKIEYTNVEVKVPIPYIEKNEDKTRQPVELSASDIIITNCRENNQFGSKRGISQKGIDFIKENEKFAARAYWDVNGITIGYGHKINKDDPAWMQKIKVGQWVQESYALKLFYCDIDKLVNNGINIIIKDLSNNGVNTDRLSQSFIDGLGDMIYNCGLNGVMTTDFYKHLKKGNIKKAIDIIPNTRVFCDNHKERRQKTKALMEES